MTLRRREYLAESAVGELSRSEKFVIAKFTDKESDYGDRLWTDGKELRASDVAADMGPESSTDTREKLSSGKPVAAWKGGKISFIGKGPLAKEVWRLVKLTALSRDINEK